MQRSLLALTAVLCATLGWQASAAPKIAKGTPYASARAALLARGWSPVRAVKPDCEPGRQDVCAAYPETQSCAGTGYGICTFDFRSRSGALIEVVTNGGSVRALTVAEVNDCPSTGCD